VHRRGMNGPVEAVGLGPGTGDEQIAVTKGRKFGPVKGDESKPTEGS
jgi:hypothetical protein